MTLFNIKNILLLVYLCLLNFVKAQTFDMIDYFDFGYDSSLVTYDYSYKEFNSFAYTDSLIVLESFNGTQEVCVTGIDTVNSNTISYNLEITKYGTKVRRTFFDTLSVENINTKFKDTVFEVSGINHLGGEKYIYGWIFPDTLMESVIDTFDSIPMYPYTKLYRYYNVEKDDSLFSSGDTLFIHYRSKYVNYNDSYFSIDCLIKKDSNLVNYSRRYWYFGEGFLEEYKLKDIFIVGVEDPITTELPNSISLSQNYPNPFNPSTTIKYSVPDVELLDKSFYKITLKVYDILGREVATLVDKQQNPGNYAIKWDANNHSSGVYYYTLATEGFLKTRKMILLK